MAGEPDSTERSIVITDEPSSKRRRIDHDVEVKQDNNGDETITYRHEDYTIGWVCSLPMDQTAPRAMLDEEHPELPTLARDDNAYILGSVGEHSVVIVCLPFTQVGTATPAPAPTTASLTTTFRSLRFLLMVGTGGGVLLGPSNDSENSSDVRLGHVVVGVPNGCVPGVVQCDFAEVANSFGRNGVFNMRSPPRFLLNCLTVLQTEREMKGTKIAKYLEAMPTKWPRLREKYCKSSWLQDVLFEANYNHVIGPGPTTAIRGICDYCDSHKNKA
ncbi:ankyrin repeat protein [Colletotrichum sojae]|uniref:Ankyrin repeat protein n=1 Tax=Colletotrichum sojae TaxID=2175907 RepID=A0A8H6MR85_9PEZI|nr:ankyrin repeat protein [Colletotrichum sojae]